MFKTFKFHFFKQMYAALNVSIYTSPIIISVTILLHITIFLSLHICLKSFDSFQWLYRRDFFSQDGFIYLGKCVAGLSLLYFSAFYIRGIGRVFNPVYRKFIDVLANANRHPTLENKVICCFKKTFQLLQMTKQIRTFIKHLHSINNVTSPVPTQ